jgi:outer membrane receptor protein involved in Fe transport
VAAALTGIFPKMDKKVKWQFLAFLNISPRKPFNCYDIKINEMLKFLLPVIQFVFICAATGQNLTVEGQLVDWETEEALPYATLIFYTLPDSSMAGNTLSENNGSFSTQLPKGRYYGLIQFMGYADYPIPAFSLQKNTDLGAIQMSRDAVALEQVQVTAEKSQMVFKLDKRVFNVGKDLTSVGNNAADILNNVPSINVDTEGNVSLRGSGSVRILVNGKPSGLLSAGESEALLRMQGDIIESVEVITNPSAKYEAEGEAGIINIILKKNIEKGFNGSFGTTVGYPTNLGASYNLNYRQRDLNFFSNFGIDYRRAPGGGNATQRFFDNGNLTDFFTSETDQTRGGIGGYVQGGLDWNISEQSLLTATLLYRTGEDDNDATVIYRDFNENESLLNKTTRNTQEIEEEHNLEAAINFTKEFEEKDRKWTLDLKYILDDDTEIADYRQSETRSNTPLIQRSSNTEDETTFLFQTDYVHPFSTQTKLEGGVRVDLRTVRNNFLVEEQKENAFMPLSEFNDRLEYTEDIYAAYLIGAHEWGPLSTQLGLRLEVSDISAVLTNSETRNDQYYTNLFPSLNLSYKLSERNQFQVSYSRRISRPYFRRLLPFSNYNNPRNNSIGNPNLRPEFTHSSELGYLRYFKNGTFLASAYYRQTEGVIERIILPADDGTTIRYPVNLATRNSYGLEFNFSYDLFKWWDITSDLNFFRSITQGAFEGDNYDADTYTWSGRINSNWDLGNRWKIQSSFDYRAPEITTQGRRLAIYSWDLGGSVDIWNGNATLTLMARDIFNTRKWRNVIDLPEYQSESVFQWRVRRSVVITLTYRLNQDKKKPFNLSGENR